MVNMGGDSSLRFKRFTMNVLLCLMFFIGLNAHYASRESPYEVINDVKSGIEAGANIIKILESDDFSSKIPEFSANLPSFLDAIAPTLSIVTMYLPQGEPEELKFLREDFASIDNTFNLVKDQFRDVKQLIQKKEMNTQYDISERRIDIMSEMLRDVLLKKQDAQEIFANAYRRYSDSTDRLYRGMMDPETIYGKNIIDAAKEYTNKDRIKVLDVMKDAMISILKGAKVDLAYNKLKNNDYIYRKEEWGRRLDDLFRHIAGQDDELKMDMTLARAEMVQLLKDNIGENNKDFAEIGYSHLTEKYYWRHWLLVAYNDITGDQNHYGEFCEGTGFNIFVESKRNVRVASVDKYKPTIPQQEVWNTIGDSYMTEKMEAYVARGNYNPEGYLNMKLVYNDPENFPASLTVGGSTCNGGESVYASGLVKVFSNTMFGAKNGDGNNSWVESGDFWDQGEAFWGGRLVVKRLQRKVYMYVFG